MSSFPLCQWENCGNMADIQCSCQEKPLLFCMNHLGLHVGYNQGINHSTNSIIQSLTDSDLQAIYYVYNFGCHQQIKELIDQMNIQFFLDQISRIKHKFAQKIDEVLNTHTRKKETFREVLSTRSISFYSENPIIQDLFRLKEQNKLSVENLITPPMNEGI